MKTESSKEYLDLTNCCVDKSEIKKLRVESQLFLRDISKISGLTKNFIWKTESYAFGIQLCQFKRLLKTYNLKLIIVDPQGKEYKGILKEDNETIID